MISPALLIEGYLQGVFPMGMEDGEIGWFSPDPRAIIPLDEGFHVPHGLKRVLSRGEFELRVNHCFEPVMRACAGREETWITGEIIESYCELHRRGFAHSVETWREGARSLANRCSIGRPTPRRWRFTASSSACASGASRYWTLNG
jgi:leucyl/phenylalanyl-tRNA--protein transferase